MTISGRDTLEGSPAEVRKLRRYLGEFIGYISSNAGMIPNYAERHRYGEAVSTACGEPTVNQVIAKRFARKQQMPWASRGAHLFLQLRTRVLDGTLENDLKRWHEAKRSGRHEMEIAA